MVLVEARASRFQVRAPFSCSNLNLTSSAPHFYQLLVTFIIATLFFRYAKSIGNMHYNSLVYGNSSCQFLTFY